jgi:hypothetical protein
MAQVSTGYNLPKTGAEMSDEELKAHLMADFKQTSVKKSNFPTEIIPLPSKGLLYSEDHPLAEGTIEMKYMTAKEEDILTSQNLIKQGVVLSYSSRLLLHQSIMVICLLAIKMQSWLQLEF